MDFPYESEYKSTYEYPDCEVLKNKLDIKDQELLERAERTISSMRLCELQEKPIKGSFDFNHLSKIHKYVFKDIYDWAGKPRTEEISKDTTSFAPSRFAVEGLKDSVFKPLKKLNYCRGMDANELSKNLAKFYCELNFGHPFREGNGRTQREFIRELAAYNGFKLDWNKANSKELMDATIGGTIGRNPEIALNNLSNIIKGCFESLEPDKSLMKDIDKLLDWDRGR
ncbi:Fic/DOC family protein [Clostridium paraputrificum]|uniref:Fic/DOC family protein n=1 Tax=Clostridium paraputrificum TaxID=29363 RepID=UPI00189D7EDB|nr:Fic family protein [Clostridium paraputrificum]